MFSQGKTVESVELLCCSVMEVLVGKAIRKNVQVLMAEKKSAWTDLDRVSFKKFGKESNVEIEKLAWTDLGKVKKASSAASVFKSFFTTGLEDLLLTRGVVDATPFAVAFSLTFSLVKK
jgi:hypothetical protein